MAPLRLYPFRYFDPRRRKWIRARYVAELETIGLRYGPFQILGPPEIRSGDPGSLTAGHLARGPSD